MHSGLRKEWAKAIADSGGGGGWDGPLCPECGWRGPGDNSEPERYVLTFHGHKDYELVPTDEHGEPKEFCGRCGRNLVWFLSFADGPHRLYLLMIPQA